MLIKQKVRKKREVLIESSVSVFYNIGIKYFINKEYDKVIEHFSLKKVQDINLICSKLKKDELTIKTHAHCMRIVSRFILEEEKGGDRKWIIEEFSSKHLRPYLDKKAIKVPDILNEIAEKLFFQKMKELKEITDSYAKALFFYKKGKILVSKNGPENYENNLKALENYRKAIVISEEKRTYNVDFYCSFCTAGFHILMNKYNNVFSIVEPSEGILKLEEEINKNIKRAIEVDPCCARAYQNKAFFESFHPNKEINDELIISNYRKAICLFAKENKSKEIIDCSYSLAIALYKNYQNGRKTDEYQNDPEYKESLNRKKSEAYRLFNKVKQIYKEKIIDFFARSVCQNATACLLGQISPDAPYTFTDCFFVIKLYSDEKHYSEIEYFYDVLTKEIEEPDREENRNKIKAFKFCCKKIIRNTKKRELKQECCEKIGILSLREGEYEEVKKYLNKLEDKSIILKKWKDEYRSDCIKKLEEDEKEENLRLYKFLEFIETDPKIKKRACEKIGDILFGSEKYEEAKGYYKRAGFGIGSEPFERCRMLIKKLENQRRIDRVITNCKPELRDFKGFKHF